MHFMPQMYSRCSAKSSLKYKRRPPKTLAIKGFGGIHWS